MLPAVTYPTAPSDGYPALYYPESLAEHALHIASGHVHQHELLLSTGGAVVAAAVVVVPIDC